MKLVNYESRGTTKVGVLREGKIVPVEDASSIEDLISRGTLEDTREKSGAAPEDPNKLRIRPPILAPDKVVLAAINYKAHSVEHKRAPPAEPYFFTKFRSCIIGNGDPILIPRISKSVDWEAELAVVIGKKCKYVSAAEALSYVAGYTVANDISFRDLQFPAGPANASSTERNWVKGKALDSSLPLGPCLVTTDEIPDPQRLRISLKVNGTQRQNGGTDDMVFSVAQLIEHLSTGLTLLPGDVISTGTPAGVAAFSGAPFLKDGDVVETSIDKIGSLRNPVRAEDPPRPPL